jgi:hypothetical protein
MLVGALYSGLLLLHAARRSRKADGTKMFLLLAASLLHHPHASLPLLLTHH